MAAAAQISVGEVVLTMACGGVSTSPQHSLDDRASSEGRWLGVFLLSIAQTRGYDSARGRYTDFEGDDGISRGEFAGVDEEGEQHVLQAEHVAVEEFRDTHALIDGLHAWRREGTGRGGRKREK